MRINKRLLRTDKDYVVIRGEQILGGVVWSLIAILLFWAVVGTILYAKSPHPYVPSGDDRTCQRIAGKQRWYIHDIYDKGNNRITTCTILNPNKDYQL